ncbi:MAG: hypothetical protein J7K95_05715 [Thermoplasmata archaeon]|nr:hypothetical protein [Thermoplasmata archaeon]
MTNWLQILIDDILRLSKEKNKPVSIEEIMKDANVNKIDAMDAIKEMKKEGLIKFKEEVQLTEKGKEKANMVYERHKAIENFFGGKEAHEIAHSLEHFLDKKDIEELKSMIKEEKEKIIDFEEGEKGIIVASVINEPKIISRIIGIGLSPMSHFRVEKKRDDEIIISAHKKLVVIDSSLANKIYAIKVGNESTIDRAT